ncbi:MAG: tetratricopeptide repeat protein [Paludibacteraceae bacterium]
MKQIRIILLIFTILCPIIASGQTKLQSDMYTAFLLHNVAKWESTTLNFEKKADLNKTSDLLQLIHLYYGWTSELIDKKQSKKAGENIQKAEEWIEKTLKKEPNNAEALNYKGVFLSYQISFNRAKAPILGKQALTLIKKAYSIAPNNVQILFDNGNAYYYPPKVLGGSKKEALKYFQKAIQIIEKRQDTKNNWIYVQTLMLEARCNELEGNLVEAKTGYEKILKIEPNFKEVKDRFYPELLKKLN